MYTVLLFSDYFIKACALHPYETCVLIHWMKSTSAIEIFTDQKYEEIDSVN